VTPADRPRHDMPIADHRFGRSAIRRRARRWSGLPVGAAAVSVLVAGCGSGTTRSAVSGGKGVLTVAINPGFVPFEQLSNGKLVGFDVELARALATQLGYSGVQFDQMPFTSLIAAVTSRRDAVAISGILDTPAREQTVAFSTPYVKDAFVLAVKASNGKVQGLAQLAHSTIAVQVGTIPEQFIRKSLPSASISTTQDTPSAFQLVAEGRADAVVTDKPVADYYVKQLGGNLRVLPKPLNAAAPIAVVMPKKSPLVAQVNAAFTRLVTGGSLNTLRQKWFGTPATG